MSVSKLNSCYIIQMWVPRLKGYLEIKCFDHDMHNDTVVPTIGVSYWLQKSQQSRPILEMFNTLHGRLPELCFSQNHTFGMHRFAYSVDHSSKIDNLVKLALI